MVEPVDEQIQQIGIRIREARKRKGYTLQDFAELVGLSVPYLSQMENGRVNINIVNLENIGRALDTPLINFFVNGSPADSISVLRRSERRWFALGEKASESLLVKFRSDLEIFVIHLEPGSDTAHDSIHQGEEFSYVIKGKVRITLNNTQIYDLSEGDIIYYKSDIPHLWQNLGDESVEILVANTPATY